jgi:FO synthase
MATWSERPSAAAALSLANCQDWQTLALRAGELRDAAWGPLTSYSRKVFIPLTHLCRDVCHYCTFAKTPRQLDKPFMTADEVLEVAKRGAAAGCKEVLFTLGDQPELRYEQARKALATLGHDSTLSYLETVARRVLEETGLLPHLNPGLLGTASLARLRKVAASMGVMLETTAERLSRRGGPHFGSPDKAPAARLQTLRLAGELRIPFTTGILIGIGETLRERIESLLAIRDLHDRYGHIQEVIIQNFRAKPGTKMRNAPEPSMDELCWTVAAARLILGADMSIQAPPNLYSGDLTDLIRAGINDWGGVSPVTADFVNPEAPWPRLEHLAAETQRAGKVLVERLTVYPQYIAARREWIDSAVSPAALRLSDSAGLARVGKWSPGSAEPACQEDERDAAFATVARASAQVARILERARSGLELGEHEIVSMFNARGAACNAICSAADELRAATVGETVSYVVTRNINYTNICLYKCGFCAFSKGKAHDSLRGQPYMVELGEIRRRVREAWDRGATEVCMQGGIHPAFTGETYLRICRAAREAVPDIHVHAFSPLEIAHGARTLGITTLDFLRELQAAGLGSLPGTAAEILDDEVRREIAPDKVTTDEWLRIVAEAHSLGLKTTATIMFGHVETYTHWARHLLRLRRLQQQTQGLTEFVPLPFVHMEAPLYLKGRARKGPTLRESVLMHAVARLALHPHLNNIQVSWAKLGPQWAQQCLRAGANDMGGTLMNESISRAAGAAYGQELPPQRMEVLIRALGRIPLQRTTLYQPATVERILLGRNAPPLIDPINAAVTAKSPPSAELCDVQRR